MSDINHLYKQEIAKAQELVDTEKELEHKLEKLLQLKSRNEKRKDHIRELEEKIRDIAK